MDDVDARGQKHKGTRNKGVTGVGLAHRGAIDVTCDQSLGENQKARQIKKQVVKINDREAEPTA